MFTGIVESVGRVRDVATTAAGGRLVLGDVPFCGELAIGESVAVNGCCLTVTGTDTDTGGMDVHFDLLQETLRVTNLGALRPGARVNLERAVAVGDRMSGHYVQGHVDCVSRILAIEPDGNDHRLEVALPAEFARFTVSRGSIAVDGISLTIADLRHDRFTNWITPHTCKATNLGFANAGDPVNLEFDLLAKYVDRMRALAPDSRPSP